MSFFFLTDTATTEIYTLSLHDALPIYEGAVSDFTRTIDLKPFAEAYLDRGAAFKAKGDREAAISDYTKAIELKPDRSEEHTSELQSRGHLVCRLLLEKKK